MYKLNNNTYKNIEIILSIPKGNSKIYNKAKFYSLNLKELKIIKIEYDEFEFSNHIFQSIKISKGKFVTILKDIQMLHNNLFNEILSFTNGKVNHIYKFEINNKTNYIIKTKTLRDIFDNGKSFENYNELINFLQNLPKPNYNNISISMCLDNYYILNAYVAIISILENKNINTYISFYILISKDFKNENINKILSTYEQYDFFNISFFRMDNRFDNATIFRYISKSCYFKLSLGEFLPNLNKVIFLDSDIIVYKDLVNLYEHNFNGYLILASPSVFINNKLIKKDLYYNSGVLLLNLKKMREIEFNKKVLQILNNGFKDNFNQWHDQAILNKFFYNYIGNLEPEYNSKLDLFKVNSNYFLKHHDYFNFTNLIYAEKFPSIYHFTGAKKPYEIKREKSDDWWFFAKKGQYLKSILNTKKKRE